MSRNDAPNFRTIGLRSCLTCGHSYSFASLEDWSCSLYKIDLGFQAMITICDGYVTHENRERNIIDYIKNGVENDADSL